MRVLKWNVPVDDRGHVVGAGKVVHVACQESADVVQVWTEEHEPPAMQRLVRVYGTGQPIAVGNRHLGSVVTGSGALVWHVYEEIGP